MPLAAMPPTLTPSTRLQRVPTALWTRAANEVVVISGHGDRFLALDEVGSDIWQTLESPATVGDLVAGLQRRYAVDAEQCHADVSAYLDTLLSHGVVAVL
jgi:hypothetical protein